MKKLFIPLATVACLVVSPTATSSSIGLTQAYEKALSHDAVLSQAKAQLESAQHVSTIAKSAFRPQISINGQYQIGNSSSSIGDVDSQAWSVNVAQSIYNRANQNRLQQAEYAVNQSDFAWHSARQDLILRVANSYFKTLLAQADLALSLSQQSSRKAELDRVKASNEVGLSSFTEVLQAQSSYDLARSETITNQNSLNIAQEELATLIGEDPGQLKNIKLDAAQKIELPDIQKFANESVNNNLNIKQLEQALEVAREQVEIDQSEHWFTINLKASYGDNRFDDVAPGLASMYGNRQDTTIGAYIDIPLYSGGSTTAKVAQAKSEKKRTEQQLRDAKQQIALQSRIHVRNIENGIAQIRALNEAVKSNQAYLDAATDSYKVGLADMLDVLTAETNTFKAKRNLTAAIYSVILAQLQLDAVANRLNEAKLVHYENLLGDNNESKNSTK